MPIHNTDFSQINIDVVLDFFKYPPLAAPPSRPGCSRCPGSCCQSAGSYPTLSTWKTMGDGYRFRGQKDSGSRLRIHIKVQYFLTKKNVSNLSEIWSGMFIPDPKLDFLPIPDPGFTGQNGTGSRIRIRNTADRYRYLSRPCYASLIFNMVPSVVIIITKVRVHISFEKL